MADVDDPDYGGDEGVVFVVPPVGQVGLQIDRQVGDLLQPLVHLWEDSQHH